jgi:cytochrome c553
VNKLSDSEIRKLAAYFQTLGFNSYKKQEDKSKSQQEIFNNNLITILRINFNLSLF